MYCRFACRRYVIRIGCVWCQERPYHDDNTASRLLSEVKHRRARLVLRWGTTLESRVLFFCRFPLFQHWETTLKSWVLLLLQHSYDTFYRKAKSFCSTSHKPSYHYVSATSGLFTTSCACWITLTLTLTLPLLVHLRHVCCSH